MKKLDSEIKNEKRKYFKNWRSRNKDKVKAINERYWKKRALKSINK